MTGEEVRRISLMTLLERFYQECVRQSSVLDDLIPGPRPFNLPPKVVREEMMETLGRFLQRGEIKKLQETSVPIDFADEQLINEVVGHTITMFRRSIQQQSLPFSGWKMIWQMLFTPIALFVFHHFFGPPASAVTISFPIPRDPRGREMLVQILKLWISILNEINGKDEFK